MVYKTYHQLVCIWTVVYFFDVQLYIFETLQQQTTTNLQKANNNKINKPLIRHTPKKNPRQDPSTQNFLFCWPDQLILNHIVGSTTWVNTSWRRRISRMSWSRRPRVPWDFKIPSLGYVPPLLHWLKSGTWLKMTWLHRNHFFSSNSLPQSWCFTSNLCTELSSEPNWEFLNCWWRRRDHVGLLFLKFCLIN